MLSRLKRVHDVTETVALPHAEQFWPMRMLRGETRSLYIDNCGTRYIDEKTLP